jgi:intracellular sulfur oxidation DsrE/DsrF family protein
MKVVLHAPTAAALVRARHEARGLLASPDRGIVRIVVGGEAVTSALDEPDPELDHLMVICADALTHAGRVAPAGTELTPSAGYLLSRLQRKGWAYVRA